MIICQPRPRHQQPPEDLDVEFVMVETETIKGNQLWPLVKLFVVGMWVAMETQICLESAMKGKGKLGNKCGEKAERFGNQI